MCKCLECGREFVNKNILSRHISSHMSHEEYYDKYLRKSEQDGKCLICGKPTKFKSFVYSTFCSQSCINIWMNQNRTEEEKAKIAEKISKTVKSEAVRERTKKTNLERYGVAYGTQTKSVQEKRKKTCQEKYGVDCTWKSEEVKQKIKDSIHERYGKEGLKSKEIRDKMIATCQEKYGTTNGGASKQAKEKIKQTNLKKFGVEYSWQASEVRDKIKQTCQERYGVEYASQSEEVKKKIVETNLKKYGVKCQYQRPDLRIKLYDEEVIKKKYATKLANKTFSSSKPENRCYELLVELFPNAVRQYRSEKYPFECDFYVPELDLYIECNFFWTHGGHFFDSTNKEDIEKLNTWKEKNNAFFNRAIEVWTESDPKKLQTAIENDLNYLVCWSEEEFISVFYRNYACDRDYPELTNKNITMIAKIANWEEYFKREIDLLYDPEILGELYINRYKYLHKLPHQLSNLELLNGLSISGKLRKYTVFDNTGMLQFIEKYKPKVICDPCAGWGERLLTCHMLGIKYLGIDINSKVVQGNSELVKKYNIDGYVMNFDSSETSFDHPECLFTCPPYWNTEIYTDIGAENLSYKDFLEWWKKVISISNSKIVAYQINQKYKTDMNKVIESLGYTFIEEIILPQKSSHFTRQNGNQKKEYESIQVFKL